ncbi:hypothetical protein [Halocatena pleomorpha]|uniref:Uncharacterized protein n=1 Tax=Halocatena pleomorpha TaxID=1785090 RepID=A0A3P3RI52_9EURY|nr:hypothetical protein [Halocatena pleomorpha]RRJ33082.1 hypothetical protein EIK79_03380 [Halocatena pleomorpha]
MIARDGVLLQVETISGILGLVLIVSLAIAVGRYTVSSRSRGTTPEPVVDNNELAFDFTNEEVQQLLRNDDELLANLDGLLANDMARLVDEDESESHYAVIDIWWSQIAKELGYETPASDDMGAYFITVATTSAYQNHSERVGEYSEIANNVGTSPFVVEHRVYQDETRGSTSQAERALVNN